MSLHDPLSDLLTRIRNAKQARHRFVDIRASKLLLSVLQVLQDHGFVEKYLLSNDEKAARVFLRYAKGREPVIHGLKRISLPGLRRYIGYADIPRIHQGMGVVILSTSQKGIVDGETARQAKIGGELLCYVW